jgi:hypothetical protein
MVTKQLLKGCKVIDAITPTAGAAGATDIEGAVADMSGFEGILAIVRFGAITAGAATHVNMQQGAAANMSDAADLAGTKITVADDDDEQVFILDLFKPRERYVRVHVDRATQNSVVNGAIYILYGARTQPKFANAATITAESHVSPAEGTA